MKPKLVNLKQQDDPKFMAPQSLAPLTGGQGNQFQQNKQQYIPAQFEIQNEKPIQIKLENVSFQKENIKPEIQVNEIPGGGILNFESDKLNGVTKKDEYLSMWQ